MKYQFLLPPLVALSLFGCLPEEPSSLRTAQLSLGTPCDTHEGPASCGAQSHCTWLGVTLGCFDTVDFMDDFGTGATFDKDLFIGYSYIYDHEVIPNGVYESRLALTNDGFGTLSGSIYYTATLGIDFPLHAYDVDGTMNTSGIMSLELSNARCISPSSHFSRPCQYLAYFVHEHELEGIINAYHSDLQTSLSVLTRATPVSGSPLSASVQIPQIGGVLDPSPDVVPFLLPTYRHDPSGTWSGSMQFRNNSAGLSLHHCELSFSTTQLQSQFQTNTAASSFNLDSLHCIGNDPFEEATLVGNVSFDSSGEIPSISFTLQLGAHTLVFSGQLLEGNDLVGSISLNGTSPGGVFRWSPL